jgi:hypothetical protein
MPVDRLLPPDDVAAADGVIDLREHAGTPAEFLLRR